MCHWLLTVAFEAWGGILDTRQRFVDGEHVGDALRAVNTEAVIPDAANKGRNGVSSAADSRLKEGCMQAQRKARACGASGTDSSNRDAHAHVGLLSAERLT